MTTTNKTPRFLLAASLAVFAAVALLAACGGSGGGDAGGGDAVAQGHDEFKKICAVCHGPDGEGMPRLGKDLHNNEFVESSSDDELVAFIIEGRTATHPDNTRGVDMPPRGGNPNLSEAQIRQIIAYMRSLN